MISFARYWLPLLVWMTVIFSASADTQSTQRTSRFLEPLLRWVWPQVTPRQSDGVRWVIRKGAHVTEYAVLVWLWWRALRRPVRNDLRPWSGRAAALALMATVIYAAMDEWHQTFVANRSGTLMDVGIDTLGGIVGLTLIWRWHRWRQKSLPGKQSD